MAALSDTTEEQCVEESPRSTAKIRLGQHRVRCFCLSANYSADVTAHVVR